MAEKVLVRAVGSTAAPLLTSTVATSVPTSMTTSVPTMPESRNPSQVWLVSPRASTAPAISWRRCQARSWSPSA